MWAMDLSAIVVRDNPERVGSLTLALEALLRWAGANVRYRRLDAALALSLRTAGVRGRACLGWWSVYGSDVFLAETGLMFGLRLRELHPPEAATGLADHQPYAQDFEASYAPLIRRALEHNQPVIAWQGWPDAPACLWGIITQVGDQGLGFAGTVMWSGGRNVPIVTPPVQLYVVEEIIPRQPDDESLFTEATRRFHATLHDRLIDDPDVVVGADGYQIWLDRLQSDKVCPTCTGPGGPCHMQHARFISANRASAIRYFRHYRDGASPTLQASIDALLAECQGSIDVLSTSREQAAVDSLIKTDQGRRALAVGVEAARSFDQAVAGVVEQMREMANVE